MYLKVHPSGEEHRWFMYRVPDGDGTCNEARRVAREYEERTGFPAEAVPNYDARHYKSVALWCKRDRYSKTRATIIEDPTVFAYLFLGIAPNAETLPE